MLGNYDTAIQSPTNPRQAYVSVFGQPETTFVVAAPNEAELIAALWENWKLAPTDKPGLYRRSEDAAPTPTR